MHTQKEQFFLTIYAVGLFLNSLILCLAIDLKGWKNCCYLVTELVP